MQLSNFSFVGEGANGRVFRCVDELGRELAVKFFTNSFDPVSRQVVQHAQSLAKINHPNVVRIISIESLRHPDKGEGASAVPALVMEFVAGMSFGNWLAAPHQSLSDLRTFVSGLMNGVQTFHDAGLSHSDLHAGNVKVVDGQAKIIDPMAHDPNSVVMTAINRDRQARDIRDACDLRAPFRMRRSA